MSSMQWKCAFYAAAVSFALIFLDIRTGAAFEGSAMGYADLQRAERPKGTAGVSLLAYPHVVQLSEPVVPHGVVSRRKRNILFPSGVKLCAQETALQVAANHLNYFHLRVCQETVWEAFKIFWDRLPEQEEYQRWMTQCQDGDVSVHDIGDNFSQSQEHQALIDARMALQGSRSSEPPTSLEQPMCGTPPPEEPEEAEPLEEVAGAAGEETDTAVEVETAAAVPEVEEVLPVVTEDSPVDNDIAVEPPTPAVLEQVVELSILLTGETYSEELRDPTSLQYQTLDRQFIEKIDDALEGLPGFKNVAVLDFRPQKDSLRLDAVVVNYAVTMLVDGGGVSAEQLDYLTLQSNKVENSYREVEVEVEAEAERPTVILTISEVQSYVTEALHNEALESVLEFGETSHPVNEATGAGGETAVEVVLETEDAGEVTIDEPMPQSPEGEVVAAAGENDVIILDESETVALPDLGLTAAAAPEADGIEEESLLLEETVVSPEEPEEVVEELPAEPISPEEPEEVVEELPAEPISPEEPEEVVEELPAEPISPAQPEEDAAPPEPSPGIEGGERTDAEEGEGEGEDDGVPDSVEEEVVAETAVEVESVPVEEEEEVGEVVVDVVAEEEVPAEPETDTAAEAVPAEPQPSGHEEDMVEAAVEKEEEAVVEQQAPPPDAPEISTEDLTEDEILLVGSEVAPAPAKPTVLSPDRESSFTLSDLLPAPDRVPVMEVSIAVEVQPPEVEEGSAGLPAGVVHSTDRAVALPVNPGRALMVFFSLRVTNMMFSDDLFNKSSAEYKALEQRFIELLVPYLQSNLSNFQNLEILNFRNGSIVVNSRMKFGKPVPRGVTTSVYLILEDFCNTAYQTMNLAIDKYSLDVESGDQADPCKFQACNEYAKCKPNRWSGEAECVCNPGYFSVDGLPCQSICELKPDFCQNDGKCDIIPGQGAICRCRVGENWWYRGEHCEEYVSEPLVVGIAIASVAGFLLVASGVIFFLARTLRDQYEKDEDEDPIRRAESLPSLERATKYNPMYESEATTGYSHYYRRYPEAPVYSSASAEASTDFSSEEMRHIYDNSELTKEEIQDRIRIVELYAKDRQFADFVRQHQAVMETRNESSSAAQT